MSRIKGLNDRTTIEKKPPVTSIKVWKGSRKTDRSAGKDLQSFFRIEAPPHLRKILVKAYDGKEDGNGSIIVEHINLTPSSNDENRAFVSQMRAFNASRPLHFCDRETIHTKFEERKDPFGGSYYQPIESDEGCPVVGTNFVCPKGCVRSGDFYFFIWELLDAGYSDLARLQVHGVHDNQTIADTLDSVKNAVGCIRFSPFVSEFSKRNIIYTLQRNKIESRRPVFEGKVRTDKRAKTDNWVVSLFLHPNWIQSHQSHLQIQQMRSLDITPDRQLLGRAYGLSLLPPAEGASLVPSPVDWLITDRDIEDLRVLWRLHNWTQSALEKLLLEMNIDSLQSLKKINKSTFEALRLAIANEQTKINFQ